MKNHLENIKLMRASALFQRHLAALARGDEKKADEYLEEIKKLK